MSGSRAKQIAQHWACIEGFIKGQIEKGRLTLTDLKREKELWMDGAGLEPDELEKATRKVIRERGGQP